jgi:hypothetical protein
VIDAIALDGSSVDVDRRPPPGREAGIIHAAVPAAATRLRLAAGRFTFERWVDVASGWRAARRARLGRETPRRTLSG